jgi:hypothetical protein
MSTITGPVIATSDPPSREILSIRFEPYPAPEIPPTSDLFAASESAATVDAKPVPHVKSAEAYKVTTSKSTTSKTVKVTKARTSKFISKQFRRKAASIKSALVLPGCHNKEGMASRHGPFRVEANPETSEKKKIFKEQKLLSDEAKACRTQWILNNQKRI